MKASLNIPYVKAYDGAGDLINPILFNYKSDGANRKARRVAEGITSTRPFSNKKGIQIVVSKIGVYDFMRFEKKVIEQGDKGTRVQLIERKTKK
tara:strand:+ start:653 stop:934 length:282 start_codon:yes stop_codon:yes gene_type:complete